MQEDYLEFVSGKRILPPSDFEEFKVYMENVKDRFPSASTCSKKILIGCYNDK